MIDPPSSSYPPELVEQMAPHWHFTHVFDTILDQLRGLGVDDADLDTMLEVNPGRWLAAGR